jgi:hypothetical protein
MLGFFAWTDIFQPFFNSANCQCKKADFISFGILP